MNTFVSDVMQFPMPGVTADTQGILRALIDALPSHVAVLDAQGVIVLTNTAWDQFALANSPQLSQTRPTSWVGVNYLEVAARGLAPDDDAHEALNGILEVLAGKTDCLGLRYACHAPDEQRWFTMTVTPLLWYGRTGALVVHANTTPCHRLLARGSLSWSAG